MTTEQPEQPNPFVEILHEGLDTFEIKKDSLRDLEKIHSDDEVHIYPLIGMLEKVTKLPNLYADLEKDERDFSKLNIQSYPTPNNQRFFFYKSQDAYLERKNNQSRNRINAWQPERTQPSWVKDLGLEGTL
tara:strand:- start:71 stop:463 length:393 start_codon:yes stop_codon:yes gene_type:complete